MDKRRCCLYLAAVSSLLFAAVFATFAFNRTKCSQKRVMKMSSTDMRLVSPVSSLWCESLELSADHPFLAYKLSKEPSISPNSLSRNEVELKWKLQHSETRHVQYFLLPGTLVTILMCSTHPGASVYVLGGKDIQNYKQKSTIFASEENYEDSFDDPDDSSAGEFDSDEDKHAVVPVTRSRSVAFENIPVSNIDDMDCAFRPSKHLFQVNITTTDTYYVFVHHKGPATRNFVKIRLFLDRTSYRTDRHVKSVHICSGGLFTTTCSVPLDFMSKDHVLIKIPGEPGAGVTAFKVRSSCKPRLGLVTAVSLAIPFVLFSFSLMIIAYTRQSMLRGRRGKHYQDSISTLASPLLKYNVGEDRDVSNVQQSAVLPLRKYEDNAKDTGHVKFPDVVPGDGDYATKEISDEPPPPYKSVEFTPEDIPK